MRTCPYCAEAIADAARKCKHCGEILDPQLREQQVSSGRLSAEPEGRTRRVPRLKTPGVGATIVRWAALVGAVSLALGILLLGAFIMDERQPATVFLDNGYSEPVTLLVDGEHTGGAGASSFQKLTVKNTAKRFVVKTATGTVVADLPVTLGHGMRYILNPGSRWAYEVRTQVYENNPGIYSPPPATPLARGALLDVTSYDFVLEDFPSKVTVRVRSGETPSPRTKTGVFHAVP